MTTSPFLIENESSTPDPQIENLRKQMRLTKESRARTIVSENEDRWPREAYEELVKQHPWLSRFNVRAQMSNSSDEGFALGYFQVLPKEIPASVAGPETIGAVSIPIIIEDNRLYPFDVYGFKGRFYPLSEESVLRVIKVRDIFRESDRRDFRRRLGSHDGDILTHRDLSSSGMRGFAGLTSKYSQVEDMFLGMIQASMSIADTKLLEKESAAKLRASFYKGSASAAGIEFRRTDSAIEARPIWRHSPDTGAPGVGPWKELPYQEVEELLGEKVAHLLTERHLIANYNPVTDEEIQSFEREARRKETGHQKTSDAAVFQQKTPYPPTPVKIRTKRPSETGEDCFGAVVVTPYKNGDSYYSGGVHALRVHDDGNISHVRVGDYDLLSVEPVDALYTTSASAPRTDYGSWLYFKLDGAIRCMELDSVCPEKDGHYLTKDGSKASIVEGIKEVVVIPHAGWSEFYIPDSCWGVLIDRTTSGSSEKASDGPLFEVLRESATSECVPESGYESPIKVSGPAIIVERAGSGRFNLKCSHLTEPSHELGRHEALRILCTAGASEAAAEEAIKLSEQGPFGFQVRDPGVFDVRTAADHVVRSRTAAARQNFKKVSAWVPNALKAARGMERSKLSSTSGYRRTVDTVLQLNFLNQDNLLQFVDLLPTFEEALSALCALLVASRLGLEEVPEQSVEGAIRALEPIIKGLRVIEYSFV